MEMSNTCLCNCFYQVETLLSPSQDRHVISSLLKSYYNSPSSECPVTLCTLTSLLLWEQMIWWDLAVLFRYIVLRELTASPQNESDRNILEKYLNLLKLYQNEILPHS